MNKILVALLIVHAALAVNSYEFRSKKIAREGTIRKSNVEYIKTNNLRLSIQEGVHEFFEGEFSTRIDHFRPLNQQRVNFVRNGMASCLFFEIMFHFTFTNLFRLTMRTHITSKTMAHCTFILKMPLITQPI